MKSIHLDRTGVRLAGLISILICIAGPARADDSHLLRPADTSSPRATLQGFIETTDDVFRRLAAVLKSYGDSGRLYPSPEERREREEAMQAGLGLANYLDLSNVPPVLRDTVALERILQLAEVLNRITVPAVADVPDRETMVRLSSKRWRLPDTEIDIALIENGPRAGEFLVSAATVDRLQEFYEKVKDLPYRPGPAAQLDAAYRAIGPATAATIYDAFVNSPLGLSFIIPPRWLLSLPDWARFRIAGATTWQWLGLSLGFLIGGLAIYCGLRLARSRTDDSENALGQSWRALALPLAYMFVAGLLLPILSILLHIGGTPRVVIEYFETGVLYLATAWLAVVVSALIGEAIVSSERLSTKSLDSQLIRLGARLIGLVAAVVVLIRGGDELGFPALGARRLGCGGYRRCTGSSKH